MRHMRFVCWESVSESSGLVGPVVIVIMWAGLVGGDSGVADMALFRSSKLSSRSCVYCFTRIGDCGIIYENI